MRLCGASVGRQCVQHYVRGMETLMLVLHEFGVTFFLCFHCNTVDFLGHLQAYCNKSGNAVLVKDRPSVGIGTQ